MVVVDLHDFDVESDCYLFLILRMLARLWKGVNYYLFVVAPQCCQRMMTMVIASFLFGTVSFHDT